MSERLEYEHGLSLAEIERQLAVTNNEIGFIVFTEQRPQAPSMNFIFLRLFSCLIKIEDTCVLFLNRIITKSGAKEVRVIYAIICSIRDARANFFKNVKLVIAKYSSVAKYKIMRDLNQVSELYAIFEELELNYFLVGGVAYDARLSQGQGIWLHDDIDIAVLSDETKRLCDAFVASGWSIIAQGVGIKIKKEQTLVDIFVWKPEKEMAVKNVSNMELKVPINHFSSDLMLLYGKRHRVASVNYIIAIEPIVKKEISKESIKNILQSYNSVSSEPPPQG